MLDDPFAWQVVNHVTRCVRIKYDRLLQTSFFQQVTPKHFAVCSETHSRTTNILPHRLKGGLRDLGSGI